MTVNTHIFWRTTLPPDRAAELLARVVPGCSLRHEHEGDETIAYVTRSNAEGWIGGPVTLNYLGNSPLPEDPEGDVTWETVIDHYPIVWKLYRYPRHEADLVRDATTLYQDLVAAVPDAVILVHNLALLLAARLPGQPIHRFPPRVTPDLEDRALWLPYRLDPLPGA